MLRAPGKPVPAPRAGDPEWLCGKPGNGWERARGRDLLGLSSRSSLARTEPAVPSRLQSRPGGGSASTQSPCRWLPGALVQLLLPLAPPRGDICWESGGGQGWQWGDLPVVCNALPSRAPLHHVPPLG